MINSVYVKVYKLSGGVGYIYRYIEGVGVRHKMKVNVDTWYFAWEKLSIQIAVKM